MRRVRIREGWVRGVGEWWVKVAANGLHQHNSIAEHEPFGWNLETGSVEELPALV